MKIAPMLFQQTTNEGAITKLAFALATEKRQVVAAAAQVAEVSSDIRHRSVHAA
jgi:hypothetical protein